MSSCAAVVSLGTTDPQTGDLRAAAVVAHLYVGQTSATWECQRITPALVDGTPTVVRVGSHGPEHIASEVAACFAALVPEASSEGRVRVGPDGSLDHQLVGVLARGVANAGVAAVVTVLEAPMPAGLWAGFEAMPGWSLHGAVVTSTRPRPAWGGVPA